MLAQQNDFFHCGFKLLTSPKCYTGQTISDFVLQSYMGCGLVLEETETAGMGTDNMESWERDICHRQREMRGKAPNIQTP